MEAAAVGMQRQIKFTSNASIKSYPNPRRADGLQPEEPNGSWESESRSIATRRPNLVSQWQETETLKYLSKRLNVGT